MQVQQECDYSGDEDTEGYQSCNVVAPITRHLEQQDLSSLVNVGELAFCEVCTTSKMHELAVPTKTESRASAVRQRVFGAIQGLFELPSVHGAHYVLSFIEDFNRLAVVKYLVKKSDALLKFLEFVAEHCACEMTIEVRIHQMHKGEFVENVK